MPKSGLFIDHPFRYVLSGEFQTRSDPRKEYRTLGKLARTSFQRGMCQPVDERIEDWFRFFHYSPPWAKSVEVTAVCENMDGRVALSLIGLALRDGLQRELLVASAKGSDESHFAYTISGDSSFEYSLEQEDLVAAQTQITEVAYDFFDRAFDVV